MRISAQLCALLLLTTAACGQGNQASAHNAAADESAGGLPPSLAPMLAKVSPAVVNISVEGEIKVQNPLMQNPLFRQFFNTPQGNGMEHFQAVGSGVIFDANHGYVVTNNHVVQHASRILVTLLDHRQLQARLVAADPQSDIAVLQVKADHLTSLPLGDSRHLEVGDYVVAIGDPFAVGQTATFGIVSAVRRTGLGIEGYENFIQTDASINPGNSGGALVNTKGELIGMNTAILSGSGGNVGIGFAIPIDMVKHVAGELIAHGKVSRGELGVVVQNLTPDLAGAMGIKAEEGALVADVQPDTPAQKAGIQAGDVITAVNGTKVADSGELRNNVAENPPGTTVRLTVLHHGQERNVSVTLKPLSVKTANAAPPPMGNNPSKLGLGLAPIPPEASEGGKVKGAMIAEVEPGSPAAAAGLEQGDIITDVDQKPVAGAAQAVNLLHNRPKNKPVLLRIRRGGQALYVTIDVS